MSPERFERIEELFHAAEGLPPAARAAFLEQACAGDGELRREVEELLAGQPEGAARIHSLVEGAAASLAAGQACPDLGRRIGPYTLIREIGRGGMGVVFQAVRTDGEFLHSVAVKLIRPGMHSEHILRRFRAERQILATLSHPNIADLLDGGTTADGRPYFIMEYIDGALPLVEYATGRGLTVRQRVTLFRPVCSAVQHAHERRVIHRDIKPGNVLVAPDGTPKLVDFGIAKSLMPELIPGQPATTLTAQLILTPGYASPEQLRGEAVTTASDIYSLGVVLYELVTGKRAFEWTGEPLAAHVRDGSGKDPPLPSRAAAGTKTRAALAGDLDTIIAKAMHRDPARRYATAAELSDDLRRHLEGLPIRARKDSLTYRTRRLIRRHRALAAALALCLVVLAGAAWMAASGSRPYRPRVPSHPQALALFLKANDLLAQDPRLSDWPGKIPPHFEQAIGMLQRVTELEPDLPSAWVALAEAHEIVSDFDRRSYSVHLDRARGAARRAIALDSRAAPAYATLGAIALYRDWDFRSAERNLRRAVELDRALHGTVRDYADLLRILGRTGEARREVARGLAADPHSARLRLQHALLLHDEGRWDEGIQEARRAASLRPGLHEADWVEGLCLEQQGRYQEAEQAFRRILAAAPADGRALPALGHLYGLMGRRQDAGRILDELGSYQKKGRVIDYSLALVHAGLGDPEAALDRLEQAWRSRDQSLPYAAVERRLERLWPAPRFARLMEKLGLAVANRN